jgi:two-component system sensor kinase
MNGTRDTLLQGSTPPPEAPDVERMFGGRFRATRLLKRGQDIETLLGVDLTGGGDVVIKATTTESLSAGAQMRLEHEAGVLRQIQNPSIAPLLHLDRQDDQLFLVVPLVPGITLESRLKRGPLTVRDTLTVGRRLMSALQEAHDHGVLHRDVKPANIVVDDESPLRRMTLIDFGLARSARLEAAIRDLPVGTARYMSPEQAGLLDHDVDHCSDLYSAGILLFECLAGRPPFCGESVGEVLRQHMTMRPPELRGLGLKVPRALDEIIQRLLRKDPRDRYQSADAVAYDLGVIEGSLEQGEAEPALVVGLHDRRRTLTEPAFVGRNDELAKLDDQLSQARGGQGSLVLLEAESGGGKTRLLAELAQRAARQGAWVLRGMGKDQAAQRPFQVLGGVAADLIAAARLEPTLSHDVRTRLGEHSEATCAALPELSEVLGTRPTEKLGPETFGQTRSLLALTALLDSLGSSDRPALVLLDDCQWADELTLKLIAEWQRRHDRTNGRQRYVMLVVAFRPEDVPAGHLLGTLSPSIHLRLPPFQTRDVKRLAESMAGPLPSEVITVIERISEGSPYMASAVLRGLVESGALVAEAAGWRVEPLAMEEVQSARYAAAFLARRIDLLPAGTTRLLSVGAVLGMEFDLDSAATLSGQPAAEAVAALDEARRRHLVWAKAQGTLCVFVHSKIRETLLSRIPEVERKELHLRAALHLERHHPENVFDLAYHFDAAGDSERALPHALNAAEQARAQHSLEIAEQQYRIAQRGAQAADPTTRYRIHEGLGDVLMLRGRYEKAFQELEVARARAKDDLSRAEIEGKLGELAFKRGDVKAGSQAVERALGFLGRKVPRRFAVFLLGVVWEGLIQALHTIMPGLFLARRKTEGAEAELMAVRLYSRLGYAYWFDRGRIPALWAHLRELNLAERYPPTLELAQAYSEHAPAMSLIPYLPRGIAYAQKSLAIRKAVGDLWGQGQSLHFYGVVLYSGSRYSECIEKCQEAVRLLERTGDRWEMNIAAFQIAASLYRLGDLKRAVAEASRIHRFGLEIGETQTSGISLDIWARASGGKVPSETIQTELDRPGADVMRTAEVMLADAVRLLGDGRPGDAADVLTRAQQLADDAGITNVYVSPLLPWLATALRKQAEQTLDRTPGRRNEILRRARRAARRGHWQALRFRNELPHALRERAILAAMAGKVRRANRLINKSLSVAEQQGAKYEYAQSLAARGELGIELGWPGANDDVQKGHQIQVALEAERDAGTATESAERPATLSLADRFDTVLDAGRQIASALTRDQIFDAVRETSLKLLRGERCLMLDPIETDNRLDFRTVAGELEEEYSRDMARKAVTSGCVVAFVEGLPEAATESVLLSGVRSALCAPILVRDKTVACLYVMHREVVGLFGDDERRLAEFIAAIAGAALENAENFAALKQLNLTLEERVRDRTEALQEQAKELARSNAELEQFAYVASHDLQEPLRMVSSYCQLLQKRYQEKLDASAQEFIAYAVGGAARMQVLIADLLAYSRVGRKTGGFEPTDSSEVLRNALNNLHVAVTESQALIAHGDLPIVMADVTSLTRLFQNLIGNAIKFRGDRRPEIRVDAERRNGEWLFSIRDNGIGIEPEFYERVFLIFQRLHTQQEYPGTGMGLAICKKTVEWHGGRIWVESESGKGSTFFFTLPVMTDEPSATGV